VSTQAATATSTALTIVGTIHEWLTITTITSHMAIGEVRRLNPNDAETQRLFAAARLSSGKTGDTAAGFTAALDADPKDAAALRGRATAYAQDKNYPAAIADFSSFLEKTREIQRRLWAARSPINLLTTAPARKAISPLLSPSTLRLPSLWPRGAICV
jgi:Flp pilus assembly protein TadD